jgi:phage repressor protein C with HTH and peptisase S24 domain
MAYEESEQDSPSELAVPFAIEGMGTRISALADLYPSRKQAAQAAGVALSSLQRWIAEEGMPAIDSVARLAYSRGVSLDWIATGSGSMYRNAAETARDEADDPYAYIPLYDARCSAGHGSWNERCKVLTKLAFTKYSLRKKGLNPANLSALRNDGDSMSSTIEDGDTVMIDESRNTLEGEGVYVVLLDEHLYAKRLQRQFDGAIHIISDNKDYRDMVVPKARVNELQILGRAVWAGGWLI